jgi:hypothetical protein
LLLLVLPFYFDFFNFFHHHPPPFPLFIFFFCISFRIFYLYIFPSPRSRRGASLSDRTRPSAAAFSVRRRRFDKNRLDNIGRERVSELVYAPECVWVCVGRVEPRWQSPTSSRQRGEEEEVGTTNTHRGPARSKEEREREESRGGGSRFRSVTPHDDQSVKSVSEPLRAGSDGV